jgi:hypothetical protein
MNIVSNRCNDVKSLVIENRLFFGYTSLLILIFETYLSLMEIEKKITSDYQTTALMCPATVSGDNSPAMITPTPDVGVADGSCLRQRYLRALAFHQEADGIVNCRQSIEGAESLSMNLEKYNPLGVDFLGDRWSFRCLIRRFFVRSDR